MKKIGYLILLIAAIVIVGNAVHAYLRSHVPEELLVSAHDGVDTAYYNESKLATYYDLVRKMNHIIKHNWHEYGEDIRSEEFSNPCFLNDQEAYYSLSPLKNKLEMDLLRSQKWKEEGYSNSDIYFLENGKLPPAEEEILGKISKNPVLLQKGMKSAFVKTIQEKLIQSGYTITADGVYLGETERAIEAYQKQYNLPVTGRLDLSTFKTIFQNP